MRLHYNHLMKPTDRKMFRLWMEKKTFIYSKKTSQISTLMAALFFHFEYLQKQMIN